MNNDKEYQKNKIRYIKLWLLLVIFFSFILILFHIYYNQINNIVQKKNIIDYKLLLPFRQNYPPPLYNFIE
jgi:hypothetical protein